MGFRETLDSLANRLHFRSETYDAQDDQGYDPSYGYVPDENVPQRGYAPSSNDYDDGQGYGAGDEAGEYEPSYGSGGGYVTAGVRPASRAKKSSGMRGLLERVRDSGKPGGGRQEPAYTQPPPNNVVAMNRYETDDGYRAPRQGADPYYQGQDRGYQEQPAERSIPAPTAPTRQASTMIYLVRRLEDAEEIITHMLGGGCVIVNMEEIDETLKRRVLDVVSGAAYALEASVKRISYRNYYVAPSGEEIVSNVQATRDLPPDDGGYRSGRDNRRY